MSLKIRRGYFFLRFNASLINRIYELPQAAYNKFLMLIADMRKFENRDFYRNICR